MNSSLNNESSIKKQARPFVSILIPVWNEVDNIEGCVESVRKQSYPKELIEILIADGMSEDGTRQKVGEFIGLDGRIRMYDNPGQIVPTGMNILLRQVKGDVVIRVDGHCLIARDYVEKCVNYLMKDGIVAVGGPMRTIESSFTGKAISLAQSSKFGVGNSSFRTESGKTKYVDTVPFPAYRKSLIDHVGLYDEELVRNQDDEYNYRIRSRGYSVLLAEDVRSTYFSRSSFRKLWRQYFQYGFYKVRVLQKHPGQMSLRQFVPFLFVLGFLFLFVLAMITSWGWLALMSMILLYLIVNLAYSIQLAFKHGFENLLRLPIAFAILHTAYGLGFNLGLFRFWNRWGDKEGLVPKF